MSSKDRNETALWLKICMPIELESVKELMF